MTEHLARQLDDMARHKAMIDEMMARADETRRRCAATRNGIGLPRGIDLTMHRPPTAAVGAARYQEFFDACAANPRPWSIDDMLPSFVLANRTFQQIPRTPTTDVGGDVPPWQRRLYDDDTEVVQTCSLPRPRADIGVGGLLLRLLFLLSVAAIAAWIILAAGR